MGPQEDPHLNYSEELRFEWFLDGIFNEDIDATGRIPIVHYLLDLNVLEPDGNGTFKLSRLNDGQSSQEVKKMLVDFLSSMGKTEKGFALVYFLSNSSAKELPLLITEE